MSDNDVNEVELRECHICGRNFRSDILGRHESICKRSASKKRKVFDSSKQRAQGIEMPSAKYNTELNSRDREIKMAQIEGKKHNWRQKHEEFINSIRAAKQYTLAKQTGQPLPPPPPPTVDPDLIQCEYCLRRFSEKAADRHIPFCRDKHARGSLAGGRGKPPSRTTLPLPGRGGDSPRGGRGVSSSGGSRRGAHSVQPIGSPQEGDTHTKSSAQAYSGRQAPPARRGMSQPSRVPRSPATHGQRGIGSRDSAGSHHGHSRVPQSPSYVSESIRPGCSQSLATGRAKYVPGAHSVESGRYYNRSLVSPPGRLEIGSPVDHVTTDVSSIDDHPPRSSKRAQASSIRRPSNYSREGSSVDTAELKMQKQNQLGRPQNLGSRSDRHNIDVGKVGDVSNNTSANAASCQDSSLHARHGLVLRSGRTQEDYVKAREFARDLIRDKSCLQSPFSPPPSGPSISTANVGGYRMTRSPVYGLLTTNETVVQVKRCQSTDDTSATEIATISHSRKKHPYTQSSALEKPKIENPNETNSFDEPNSPRPCEFIEGQAPVLSLTSLNSGDFNHPRPRSPAVSTVQHSTRSSTVQKFCHECGSHFPSVVSKFCPECGVRRLNVN